MIPRQTQPPSSSTTRPYLQEVQPPPSPPPSHPPPSYSSSNSPLSVSTRHSPARPSPQPSRISVDQEEDEEASDEDEEGEEEVIEEVGARVKTKQEEETQHCWICYVDETEPGKLWTHCKCTLVAHPDCLLTWLSSSSTSLSCPVCSTPYSILDTTPPTSLAVLKFHKFIRRRLERLSVIVAVLGGGAGVWTASAGYGLWAVKMWAGEDVWKGLVEGEKWGWGNYLNLPLIPLTLLLSRTPLIDSLLPFLPLSLLLSFPSSPNLSLTHYPPSASLTLCTLPWLRVGYLKVRKAIFDTILYNRVSPNGEQNNFWREFEVGEGEDDWLDGGALPPGGAGDEEGGEGVQRRRREGRRGGVEVVAEVEMIPPPLPVEANVNAPPRQPQNHRLRLGLTRFTSLIVGALLFPAFSALAGSALLYLATKTKSGSLLRRLLGVDGLLNLSGIRGTSSSSGGIKNVGVLTTLLTTLLPFSTKFLLSPSSSSFSSPSTSSTSRIIKSLPPGPFGELDPIWIRNTFGAGIVLVLRDVVELIVGVLEEKRRGSRKVLGKPVNVGAVIGASGAGSARERESDGGEAVRREEARSSAGRARGNLRGRGERRRTQVVHNLLDR